jgi:hypothetical protein
MLDSTACGESVRPLRSHTFTPKVIHALMLHACIRQVRLFFELHMGMIGCPAIPVADCRSKPLVSSFCPVTSR